MAEKRTIELEVDLKDNIAETTEKTKSLKAQLREMKAQLANMDEGTEEFKKLTREAGKLQDKIGDISTGVKNFASDTRRLDATLQGINTVTNAFGAVEGSMALVGIESEDLQKTMVKLQSAMLIVNSVTEISNALQAESALMQTLNSAATKAAAIAQGAYALVVGTTTGALKAFRIALATTGIGAIVVLLGMAASAMDLFGNSTEDAEAKQKELEKQLEKTNLEIERSSKLYEDLGKTVDTVSQQELINAKKRGASEEELNKIKKEGVQSRIDLVQAEVDEAEKRYLKFAKSGTTKQFEAAEKTWKEKSEKLTALKLQIEDEEASEIYDKRKENQQKLNDLRNSELEKIKQFQLEASEANEARNRRTFEQEVYLINKKYDEQIKLAKKYKKDVTQIEKARENEINDVRKNNKDLQVQIETTALNKIQIVRDNKFQTLKGQLNAEVQAELDAALRRTQILEDQANRAKTIDERANSFKVKSFQQGLEIVSSITELFGKKSEKQAKRAFQVQKAAQVASALINTYQSATGAYASQFLPIPDPTSPVRGGIAAGLAVAAGLVNVAKIASQKFEGGSTGGGGGTPGGSIPDAQMAAPQFNTIGSSGINQLATLQQQPVQAYVVSGEVTSAQSLDRNRVQNATL